MKVATIARGFVDPRQRKGVRRIVVTVDDALFERLRAEAARQRKPMAAAIRQAVVRGLDAGAAP